MSKDKKRQIRNSTAEFLIFTRQAAEEGIEVRVAEETVWLTQKLVAAPLEVTAPTVNEHLADLYAQGEISQVATIRNFRTVPEEEARAVSAKRWGNIFGAGKLEEEAVCRHFRHTAGLGKEQS